MAEKKKSEAKLLQEKLCETRKNGLLRADDKTVADADKFCEGYKAFMNAAKTEREASEFAENEAVKLGFRKFEKGMKLKAGDKVEFFYVCDHNKLYSASTETTTQKAA
jgi:aspartyl aminopeptidase